MEKKQKNHLPIIISLLLIMGLVSFSAMAKNDNGNAKSEKSPSSQGRSNETKNINLKNFEKADKAAGKTNAKIHEEKTKSVIQKLHQVSSQEQAQGSTEVSREVKQIALQEQAAQQETVQAMEQVEKRSKIKIFLIGNDYKNLGQLRSSLVHNRNQIRALTRTMAQIQNGGDAAALQQQVETFMQERERIKSIITANESSFSLFGWVSRFLSGYEQAPINEQEEKELVQEAEAAIGSARLNENGMPFEYEEEGSMIPNAIPPDLENPELDPDLNMPSSL